MDINTFPRKLFETRTNNLNYEISDFLLKETLCDFICGGAARKAFMGNSTITDFDLFITNSSPTFLTSKFKLKSERGNCTYGFNKTYTFEYEDQEYTAQFITIQPYSSLKEIFQSFDFTICQFAMDKDNFHYTPGS